MEWLRRASSAGLVVWLLLALAVLSSLGLGAGAAGAHDTDVTASPDFRFRPPRVIVGFRGGWAFNRSDSDVYRFFTENLTLSHSDFDAPAFTLDVGVRVTSWLDVVTGVELSARQNTSEFRYFIEDNGNPIEQKTRLVQVPVTLSLKLYPIGRGRQVGTFAWVRSFLVPYVGGGIGGTYYHLRQKGDFVDTEDQSIFEAEFESDGWAFSQHVFAGLDIKLTRNFGLVLEGRYYWAKADVEGDFVGFDDIDLDGARAMIGFNLRI